MLEFIALLASSLPPLVYLALVLTLVYLMLPGDASLRNIPPMPHRPDPLIGHLRMLKADFRGKVNEWSAKTEGIFSMYIGRQLVVVIGSHDIMKAAFVKQADMFTNRPSTYLGDTVVGYKGVLNASGELWKENRSVLMSILRKFGMGRNLLAEKIDQEVDVYLETLRGLNQAPRDVHILTSMSVSNVICSILGKRFNHDDESLEMMIKTINNHAILIGKAAPLNMYPALRFLPGDPFKTKELTDNFWNLTAFVRTHFIDPMRKSYTTNDDPDSVAAAYMQEKQRRDDSGRHTELDDECLERNIFFLFLAGSETTSSTIMWFIILMLHHPDVLEKIQNEMSEEIGNQRRPTIHEKAKLVYLNACIMEVGRFGSIVPFSLMHVCSQTTTLAGYTIPKDTYIIPNLDSVLHSEKTWGDPHTFRPERFIDAQGKLKQVESLIPFGVGRRACLGESLARMELFLFLSGMCFTFNIRPEDPAHLPPLEAVFGLTSAPEPFAVKFSERNHDI